LRIPGASLGYQRRLAPGIDLMVQGRIFGCYTSSCTGRHVGGVTLGLVLLVASPQRNQGLFLQPLLRLEAQVVGRASQTRLAVGAGLGLGYQLTVGNFFFAPYIALSHNVLVDPRGVGRPQYSPGVDFGGFRIGVAFDADNAAPSDVLVERSARRHAL